MSEIIENLLIDLSNQQYLDIFMYIFMIFFLYLGWKKGAVFQIFYLFSLLIAVSLSFRYSDEIGAYISSWLNSNLQLSEVFGGIIIFVAIFTIASFLQNVLNNRIKTSDLGSKTLGAAISLLVSNLILTLIFTGLNILNLPALFENSVKESNLVNFYVSPEGSPQQTLEVIIGTDLLKVVNRINYLTGKSSVVVDDDGCLEIPRYNESNLQSRQDFSIEIYNLLSLERQNENIDGLELNQILSNVANQIRSDTIIIYSTCTTEIEENQRVILRLKKQYPNFSVEAISSYLPNKNPTMQTSEGYWQTFPHLHDMDGSFAVRLRKV